MSKKILAILMGCALILLLTACVARGNAIPDKGWTTLTEETLGISVSLPDTWASKSTPDGGLFISNDAANFASPIIVNGVAVAISTLDSAQYNNLTDPIAIVDTYAQNIQSIGASLQPIGAVETWESQGYPAATGRYRGTLFDQAGEITFTAIVHGSRIASIMTIDTTDGQTQTQVLQQITRSVAFLK
ncbi:MAG: hypothetical protein Fur0018_15480 [Anaerolineales bacterium]